MAHMENVVLTNMCMICDGDNVLVQDRREPGWPGLTFPGGHVEPKESIVKSVIREVWEETGLTVDNVRLCGLKQFTMADGSYRYIVLFFRTDTFCGELRDSAEGHVFWINRQELRNQPLADGFDSMLDVFENEALTENYHWFDGVWRQENL